MSTLDKKTNIYLKKFLTQQQLTDNFLEYLLRASRDVLKTIYPDSGFFYGGTLGGAVDQVTVSTPLVASDGLGRVLALDASLASPQFENALAAPYHVGLRYNEFPSGTEVNVRTGQIEYSKYEEAIGELAEPDSVVDNGTTITLVVDSITEASVDNTGRQVKVWLKKAVGQVDAFYDGVVYYSGGQNKVDTTHLLGQTAGSVSTTVSDYQVMMLGPTVKKNTDLSLDPNVAYLGTVTGAGSGNTPSTFDQSGKRILQTGTVVGRLMDELKSFFTGGGLISWDQATSTLTWSAQFQITIPHRGYTFTIASGSQASIAADDVLYVLLDEVGGAKSIVKVASGSMPEDVFAYPIAYRYGNDIYFRDGALELKGDATSSTSGRIQDITADLLTYIGASNESDADPDYSSLAPAGAPTYISDGNSLTQALKTLDVEAKAADTRDANTRIFVGQADSSDTTPDYAPVGAPLRTITENQALESAIASIDNQIDKFFGQLQLIPHETSTFKARITGANISMLDSTVIGQELRDKLIDFDGAVINFNTGVILKADDATPLGINFSPFSITASNYFWYGFGLNADTTDGLNRITIQVVASLASAENATDTLAPYPTISGDKRLGFVQIYNNAGTLEVFKIRQLGIDFGTQPLPSEVFDVAMYDFVDESTNRLTPVTGAPGAGQFRTFGIQNRASIPDITQDLKPRIGTERILCQAIAKVENEFGPSDELVYRETSDLRGLIRFVGGRFNGEWLNSNTSSGVFVLSQNQDDFVEVTFFGTGLRLLTLVTTAARDIRKTTDGGAESGNLYPATPQSILSGQGFAPYTILPIDDNLTQGLHTIKIRNASATENMAVYGFEILNESTNVNVRPGTGYVSGNKLALAVAATPAYNATFDSILRDGGSVGSLGTRGARVLTYLKSDGTIGKSAVETDSTTLYLGSADHSNEEIVQRYNVRSLSSARTDDLSTDGGPGATRHFTSDDNQLTIHGTSLVIAGNYIYASATGYIAITFKGTGLDLIMGPTTGGAHSYSSVTHNNGASVGTISFTETEKYKRVPVASGLKYGVHTIVLNHTAIAPAIYELVVYQQALPALPSGAIALQEYNICANYSFGTGQAVNGRGEQHSDGSIEHYPVREMIYQTDWVLALVASATVQRHVAQSNTDGAAITFAFTGTAIEAFATITTAATFTIQIDGVNYTGAASVNGGTWTGGTSSWAITDATYGSRISISGLTYKHHTIKLILASHTGIVSFCGFAVAPLIDAIVSAPESDFQFATLVGNCGMIDRRRTSPIELPEVKPTIRRVGTYGTVSTTSTAYVNVPDMCKSVRFEKPGIMKIKFNSQFGHTNGGAYNTFKIAVNGRDISKEYLHQISDANYGTTISFATSVPVEAGDHFVQLMMKTSAGTGSLPVNERELEISRG